MKKLFSFMLVLTMAFVLAACGDSNDGSENTDDNAGNSEDPDTLVIGFVPSQDSGNIADNVVPLAERLSEKLGIDVESTVTVNFNALL